ncbi:hypothetical protein MRX96_020911 [Rhipicephalus microplus]
MVWTSIVSPVWRTSTSLHVPWTNYLKSSIKSHAPQDESVSSSEARSGAADEEWRETDWAEERQPVVVLPRKTTDITKIKGWRHKAFGPRPDCGPGSGSHDTLGHGADERTSVAPGGGTEAGAAGTDDAESYCCSGCCSGSSERAPGVSASNQAAPQPEATIKIDKQENLQAAEMSMSKGVRCAFLSSKLDEFLQHQSELRVVQLAQLNPNILPLPEGQGVLALSNPVLACKGPEGASRQDTKRASAGARIEHWNTSAAPAVRRRQHSSSTTDKAAEEPEVPSPSPSKPVAGTAAIDNSLPKSPAKRAKIEAEEDAPFLAMTSRRITWWPGAQYSEGKFKEEGVRLQPRDALKDNWRGSGKENCCGGPLRLPRRRCLTHAASAPKGVNVVKKGRPPSKEAVTKKSIVDMSKTTCKPKVKALSVPAIPTSPT